MEHLDIGATSSSSKVSLQVLSGQGSSTFRFVSDRKGQLENLLSWAKNKKILSGKDAKEGRAFDMTLGVELKDTLEVKEGTTVALTGAAGLTDKALVQKYNELVRRREEAEAAALKAEEARIKAEEARIRAEKEREEQAKAAEAAEARRLEREARKARRKPRRRQGSDDEQAEGADRRGAEDSGDDANAPAQKRTTSPGPEHKAKRGAPSGGKKQRERRAQELEARKQKGRERKERKLAKAEAESEKKYQKRLENAGLAGPGGEEELNEDSETDESNAFGSESSSDSPSAAAPSQAKSKKPIRLHKDDVNNIESNDNHSLVMERQQEDAIPQRERLYDFHGDALALKRVRQKHRDMSRINHDAADNGQDEN